MLWTASGLTGYAIGARDRAIGSVADLYFDEQNWTVRWLVVDTGTWLPGRRVLITPFATVGYDLVERTLSVSLTSEQVKNSPDIDTHRPVSRQMEENLLRHYGWSPYWAAGAGGAPVLPTGRDAVGTRTEAAALAELERSPDRHLRSTQEVTGYNVHASDGYIGHIDDFLVDADTWALRYVVIDTRNWLPGKHVIVSPAWFSSIDWTDREVQVKVTRQAVKDSPEYDPNATTERAYESRLYGHYGYPVPWD